MILGYKGQASTLHAPRHPRVQMRLSLMRTTLGNVAQPVIQLPQHQTCVHCCVQVLRVSCATDGAHGLGGGE